jgi:hypothetical protein
LKTNTGSGITKLAAADRDANRFVVQAADEHVFTSHAFAPKHQGCNIRRQAE